VAVESRAVAKGGKWLPIAELSQVPLTGITRKALRKLGVL
jgi:hypothetical protein